MPEVNFFFGVFMDRDKVDIDKNAKRTRPYLEQQISFVRKRYTQSASQPFSVSSGNVTGGALRDDPKNGYGAD